MLKQEDIEAVNDTDAAAAAAAAPKEHIFASLKRQSYQKKSRQGSHRRDVRFCLDIDVREDRFDDVVVVVGVVVVVAPILFIFTI